MSANSSSYSIGILFSLCVVLRMLVPFNNALSSAVWAQAPTSNWDGVLRTDGLLPANEGTALLDSGTNHYSAQPVARYRSSGNHLRSNGLLLLPATEVNGSRERRHHDKLCEGDASLKRQLDRRIESAWLVCG
jgi:hypothetical protein